MAKASLWPTFILVPDEDLLAAAQACVRGPKGSERGPTSLVAPNIVSASNRISVEFIAKGNDLAGLNRA